MCIRDRRRGHGPDADRGPRGRVRSPGPARLPDRLLAYGHRRHSRRRSHPARHLAVGALVSIPNVLASRYASAQMRAIWSPEEKIIAERRLWVAVLTAQRDLGVA